MELQDEILRRALLGVFFFPAVWLLHRRQPGSLLVAGLLAALCGTLLLYSPNGALILYALGCGFVYGDRWDRGVAIVTGAALGLILLELLCKTNPMDSEFFVRPAPLIAEPYAVPLKFVLLIGLPHLVLWLWPLREMDPYGNELKAALTREESIAAQCEAVRKCSAEGADSKAAIPWILQLLKLTPEEKVRHACIEALKRIGEPSPDVIETLTMVRENPTSGQLRHAAEEALKVLSH